MSFRGYTGRWSSDGEKLVDQESIVLITGAARGLGNALLAQCHASNRKVLALVRKDDDRRDLEARYPGTRVAIGDVAVPSSLAGLEQLIAAEGRLDVVINNAGMLGKGPTLAESSPDVLLEHFRVHCLGAFNVAKLAVPFMLGSTSATIINISSRLGSLGSNADGAFEGQGMSYAYRIAKAAQNMLTLCLSQELHTKRIKVCAIAPGRLATAEDFQEAATHVLARIAANNLTSARFNRADTDHGTNPW